MNNTDNINILKRLLFWLMLALIATPGIFHFVGIDAKLNLKGDFKTVENPNFIVSNWFSGKYQEEKADYLNQNYRLRSYLVKFSNQLNFSLFRKSGAKEVIIGKDDYLYEKNYILAHYGLNYDGDSTIIDKVAKLRIIRDSLAKYGVEIITALAPGKASFFPEFIPNGYKPKTINALYELWKRELVRNELLCFDIHRWFRNMKETSLWPLYPKTGVHWSAYGEILVTDSLMGFLENVSGRKMRRIIIDSILHSSTMRFRDEDAEEALNIFTGIPDLEMGYPFYHFSEDTSLVKPKVIVIADSYYWGIIGRGISSQLFKDQEFWYYFAEVHAENQSAPVSIDSYSFIEKLKSADFVILMSTDANLDRFPFGFIEKTYEQIHLSKEKMDQAQLREEKILSIMASIKSSPDWLNSIKQKAKDQSISLDEAIRKDAEYVVDMELNKEK